MTALSSGLGGTSIQTQECVDGVQSLLVGHQLRNDVQIVVLAVFKRLLANRLRSETFGFAVRRRRRELGRVSPFQLLSTLTW